MLYGSAQKLRLFQVPPLWFIVLASSGFSVQDRILARAAPNPYSLLLNGTFCEYRKVKWQRTVGHPNQGRLSGRGKGRTEVKYSKMLSESPSTKNSHVKCKSTLDSGLLILLFLFLLLSHSLLTSSLPGQLDIQVPCRCPITSGWGRSCTALLAKIPPRPGDRAKQCNHIQGFYNFCFDC